MNIEKSEKIIRNRTELIFELAKYVRSTSIIPYHTMISWPTEQIRRLVEWYERDDKARFNEILKKLELFVQGHPIIMTFDLAEKGGDHTAIYLRSPFANNREIRWGVMPELNFIRFGKRKIK